MTVSFTLLSLSLSPSLSPSPLSLSLCACGSVYACVHASVCVRISCVCMRVHTCMRACVLASVRASFHVCVCVCVCVCICACLHACVCVFVCSLSPLAHSCYMHDTRKDAVTALHYSSLREDTQAIICVGFSFFRLSQ